LSCLLAEDAGQPIASKQQDASFSEIDGKILRVKSEGDMKSELDYRKELEVERQKVNNLTSRINELTIAVSKDICCFRIIYDLSKKIIDLIFG